ncbi:uncharacterized protein si:dkey-106l3.7 isoform X2 [Labrus mixtus]|uniref:uncharacterized protein si:dkey-106l3.7 isoform X2 n=1 Tax=Labrus mixtus TaxID=508554 RepID=UPI0029C095C8|nr:uncharacterized protein si:dkey-106l3.7 isoform X2 [Labrus mixtus]
MNLYRSFGNLMEAWVTEGGQGLDSEWPRMNENSPTPSSNLRSESVDSGVETASSETSFPATSRSISTDNAEIDATLSQSPVLSSPVLSSSSSSSLNLHPSRDQEESNALHQKLERTLRRTDSKCLKEDSEIPKVEEVLRRRPKRHTSEPVRGQRSVSESFCLRRTVNPSALTRHITEMCRRPPSMTCDEQQSQTRLEVLGEEKKKELSPGLLYLEQVCQMLEEIARQQMHSQALQKEMDALREHEELEMEAVDSCHSDSKAAEEDFPYSQNVAKTNSLDCRSQQRKDYPYRHFRQRSASDTTIALLRLRMLKTDCRGQHLSTDGLQKEEEVHKKQESDVAHKNWKLKFGSLGREESAARDIKGQHMQPSERNSPRRRLSQMFRRSRKTLPE